MAQSDLVSLLDVKTYLSLTTVDTLRDATLSRLITQISRAIFNSINRNFVLPKIITDTYDGNGQDRLQLKNWPVISVNSLTIEGSVVPLSSLLTSSGYVLEPPDLEPPGNMQILYLRNYWFNRGTQNILVTYLSGYLIQNEIFSVPAVGPYTYQALSPFGIWGSDFSVAFASGSVLFPVQTAPATGQYTVSSTGLYTFSAADAGKIITLGYGYIPADLTQCALEWIAYRWATKDRVGYSSKSLGGAETVSFTNEAVPVFVAQSLQNFKRVVPC